MPRRSRSLEEPSLVSGTGTGMATTRTGGACSPTSANESSMTRAAHALWTKDAPLPCEQAPMRGQCKQMAGAVATKAWWQADRGPYPAMFGRQPGGVTGDLPLRQGSFHQQMMKPDVVKRNEPRTHEGLLHDRAVVHVVADLIPGFEVLKPRTIQQTPNSSSQLPHPPPGQERPSPAPAASLPELFQRTQQVDAVVGDAGSHRWQRREVSQAPASGRHEPQLGSVISCRNQDSMKGVDLAVEHLARISHLEVRAVILDALAGMQRYRSGSENPTRSSSSRQPFRPVHPRAFAVPRRRAVPAGSSSRWPCSCAANAHSDNSQQSRWARG